MSHFLAFGHKIWPVWSVVVGVAKFGKTRTRFCCRKGELIDFIIIASLDGDIIGGCRAVVVDN